MRTVDEPRDGPPDCSEGAGGRLEKTVLYKGQNGSRIQGLIFV